MEIVKTLLVVIQTQISNLYVVKTLTTTCNSDKECASNYCNLSNKKCEKKANTCNNNLITSLSGQNYNSCSTGNTCKSNTCLSPNTCIYNTLSNNCNSGLVCATNNTCKTTNTCNYNPNPTLAWSACASGRFCNTDSTCKIDSGKCIYSKAVDVSAKAKNFILGIDNSCLSDTSCASDSICKTPNTCEYDNTLKKIKWENCNSESACETNSKCVSHNFKTCLYNTSGKYIEWSNCPSNQTCTNKSECRNTDTCYINPTNQTIPWNNQANVIIDWTNCSDGKTCINNYNTGSKENTSACKENNTCLFDSWSACIAPKICKKGTNGSYCE
jgi:hypothetical protein